MLPIRRTHNIQPRGKRAGFSLIIVLIISLVGFAIVGVTLQLTVLSSGSGRVVSAAHTKYNILQDAVEEGKAALKKAMVGVEFPLTFDDDTFKEITSADMLLVDYDFDEDEPKGVVYDKGLNRSDLGRLGIAGNGGSLKVAIYDMQYDPRNVGSMTPDDLHMLPPSISPHGNSAWIGGIVGQTPPDPSKSTLHTGVYLIRATLEVEGAEKRTWILDSAMIQSNAY